MHTGAARGVALGLAWIVLAAGCQTAPPPRPQAPPVSPPSSPEEAQGLFERLRLEATKTGFVQDGKEFSRADIAPLFDAAGSQAKSRFDQGTEQEKKARTRIAGGAGLMVAGIGGAFGAMLAGAAIGVAAAFSDAEEDEDADDYITATNRTAGTVSLLGVLGGSGILISSRGPSRDAAASFRQAADAYNADLSRRLGLLGPAQ